MSRTAFDIVLQRAELIAPRVKHFVFERADGAVFDFIPGQFITLELPYADKILRRSYSLACAPDSNARLELAAAYVEGGTASELLFKLQPGQAVAATGPFGRLVLPDDTQARYILVATGTGVTPYLSMLPELAKRMEADNTQVVLLQGVRTPAELLYGERFLTFASQQPSFRYLACYSRSPDHKPQAHERLHRLQQGFSELALQPEHDVVYLCGNPNMIDEAFAYLSAQGFASKQIKREKYISAK
jgi:ferredoxin-NADP reductase